MNQIDAAQVAAVRAHFRVLLSATPRGARLARLLAVEWLRARYEVPYRVTVAAAQVVAELAANAATHGRVAGRSFRVVLLVSEGVLRVEVTDTRADGLPHRRPPSLDAESGRGLLLVEALADRWGATLGPAPQKTVWAELALHATGLPPGGAFGHRGRAARRNRRRRSR
ncbi:ATP-binding protein [Streptomyces ficellus]|uniref:ATP-binding protein n=1 Tax=Streptomyces ficellus TaxID=1977088 RepID=A0A6I6F911_9ACTN|nr:ATP-binding protein [Streptomyces ficellus]QGV79531.1 ATP-binding protein [Streptomyces ficellus]